MSEAKLKPRCSESVMAEWHSHPCKRAGAYEHNGKHYCKTHFPPNVEEKNALRSAAWSAERAKRRIELAAPDLLEATRLCLDALTGNQLGCTEFESLLKQARAAIAKATGESA